MLVFILIHSLTVSLSQLKEIFCGTGQEEAVGGEECFKLVPQVSTIYIVITGKVKGDQ